MKKRLNIFINSLIVNLFAIKEIALTESRKFVKIKEGIKEEKLVVLPNGLDISKFNFDSSTKASYKAEICAKYDIPQNAFIFGNVSRTSAEKGHSVLLDAFAEFLKTAPNRGIDTDRIYLVIAGGGPLEATLADQAKKLSIANKVRITGRFDSRDHSKFYGFFDAFVFPSLAEGFGIVLIEAMAAGLPVICSDLEVLQEVGGATIRYFEAGDYMDLVDRMVDLYARYDRFDALCDSARKRAEELFSMDKFVVGYENLYKELLVG